MLKIVKLPVKVITMSQEDEDRRQMLGLPPEELEPTDVMISVNVESIAAYYKIVSDNTLSLHLNNSESPWKVFMSVEEFEELIGIK